MAIQFNCPSCNQELFLQDLNTGDAFMCPHCDFQGIIPETVLSVASDSKDKLPDKVVNNTSDKYVNIPNVDSDNVKFPAVKALSSIISVLAWILFAVSMIMGLMAFSNGGFFTGIPIIVGGTLILIINLAISQLLLLFLAIEENTRK